MGTLRQECKERLKVAFDQARAVKSSLTFILVVDQYALKVLSNTIKMMELINYGITSVQRLQLKRKKFHKIEAVYLIHPNSYQQLLDDYSVAGQPQYHSIHVLFLTTIPPKVMSQLSDNQQFVKRVASLKELNMNFLLHSSNQFLISSQDKQSFSNYIQAKDLQLSMMVNQTANQLATIATSFSSFFIVQILYKKSLSSNISQKIADGLKAKLDSMFKIYDKTQCNNYNNSASQTTFLILDRGFDPVSPLVRDFHYGPLMYDLKEVKDHKITLGQNKKTSQKKIHNFAEGDELYEAVKFLHLSQAMDQIPKKFQDFSKNNVAAKFQKNGDEKDMNKMAQVMKKIPQYNKSKQKYGLHIDLIGELFQSYKDLNLKKLGQLQQSIISNTNQLGKKCKPDDLFQKVVAILSQLKSQDQKARLLAISLMCLQLKPKYKNTLIQECQKLSKYSQLPKKIVQLTGHSQCLLNYRKQKGMKEQSTLILDKHVPKIEQIVKDFVNGNVGDLKFLRVGSDLKNQNQKAKLGNAGTLGRKKIGIDNQSSSKPRLIIFIASAIGYNQIRAISQLAQNYHLIIGSNNFVTPMQYIKLIQTLEV